MQICNGIKIVNTSLFIEKERILVINDLHIGYEESLHLKGILVPRNQLKEIIKITERILNKVKPKKVIINGDLKHVFGKILDQEWKEILQYFDFLLERVEEVIIVQGNHDPIIKPIAEKRGIRVVSDYKIGKDNIHIVHGDEIVKTNSKTIIIGHEHTAITIRDGSKSEKYKCFLLGKFKKRNLIVVPSFNPLVEGTDILQGNFLSPYLDNVQNFKVFIVNEGQVFDFGKLKNLNLGAKN